MNSEHDKPLDPERINTDTETCKALAYQFDNNDLKAPPHFHEELEPRKRNKGLTEPNPVPLEDQMKRRAFYILHLLCEGKQDKYDFMNNISREYSIFTNARTLYLMAEQKHKESFT